MMKKMMTLVMVLAMASLATAGIAYDMAPTTVGGVTFTIDANDQLIGTGSAAAVGEMAAGLGLFGPIAGIGADGTGAFNGSKTAAAGDLGGVSDYFGWGGFDLSAGTAGQSAPADGVWFILDITGAGALEIYDYAVDFYTPAVVADITAIPEPMTLGLLGLGGLFLRRRK